MPLLVDRGSDPRIAKAADGCVEIGLVNNMPDTALEATERQFIALLEAACGETRVRLRLFSLPGIPRGERGQRHVDKCYRALRELPDSGIDALIVTGTEPRAASLRNEPYWHWLAELIDWAEANTVSTVWSCLAAHAAVLHLDGIARHPLADKCFGVFDCAAAKDHPLTAGQVRMSVPHSRWNELREDELLAHGYEVLTRAQAGVDLFARQGRSLFVFLQGHPEYDALSLLGEYRRDFARFLRGEREVCPNLPHGYFDAAATQALTELRTRALADRREELLAELPVVALEQSLRAGWRQAAERLYANWLGEVAARKSRQAAAPARIAATAGAGRPAAFVERRRRSDPSGFFTGARDRRVAART
jgi:homoserine O-succinyltransferase/O-acetyltransferase